MVNNMNMGQDVPPHIIENKIVERDLVVKGHAVGGSNRESS